MSLDTTVQEEAQAIAASVAALHSRLREELFQSTDRKRYAQHHVQAAHISHITLGLDLLISELREAAK